MVHHFHNMVFNYKLTFNLKICIDISEIIFFSFSATASIRFNYQCNAS